MSVLLGNLAEMEQEDDEEFQLLEEQREAEIRRKQQLEEEESKRRKAAQLQAALLGDGIIHMEENLKDMEEVSTIALDQLASLLTLCLIRNAWKESERKMLCNCLQMTGSLQKGCA